MSTSDNINRTFNPSKKQDVAMSTDKTPNNPPPNTTETTHTGEPIQNSEPAAATHHQYYAFGTKEEEWIPGSYSEPFIWPSPNVLPYSENYYSVWEGLPSRRTISAQGLESFKKHATPITKEEYDRLTHIKCARQEADSRAEYMWSGPRYDDDE